MLRQNKPCAISTQNWHARQCTADKPLFSASASAFFYQRLSFTSSMQRSQSQKIKVERIKQTIAKCFFALCLFLFPDAFNIDPPINSIRWSDPLLRLILLPPLAVSLRKAWPLALAAVGVHLANLTAQGAGAVSRAWN